MPYTVGSLFAGIGGFDLGFERAGFEVKWQVEIDPWCRKVLAKNFPNAERYEDVRTVGTHNLSRVDVICGGFPCQDISYAGLGAGIEGERSGLWTEYARIISELRPRFVLVENVTALLTRGLSRVLGDLAAFGYDAEWDCIPAAAVGAPHIRDRVWILAYPGCEFRGAERWGYGVCGRYDLLEERNARLSQERREDRELVALVPGVHPGVVADWWLHQCGVARTTDGVRGSLDARNGGLGNAVVPQIPEMYARRIKEVLEAERCKKKA